MVLRVTTQMETLGTDEASGHVVLVAEDDASPIWQVRMDRRTWEQMGCPSRLVVSVGDR